MDKKENVFKKLKRIFTGLIAPLFIALPASSQAQNKEANINDTSKIEDNIEDNDTYQYITTNSDDKLIIDKEKITTTLRDEIKVTIPDEQNNDKTEINNSIKSKVTYSELLFELNNEIKKKNFNTISSTYLKAVLDNIYKNYDEWKQINKDLPKKEDYIKQNIIDNIKNINSLNFYSKDSEEGKKNIEQGKALGYTDKNLNITMVYGDNDSEEVTERLAHELEHINQRKIVFNNDYFKGNEYLKKIIIEGGATSKMKYSKPLKTEKLSSDVITANGYSLEYKNNNGEGYSKEMNLYNNLEFLAGYDVMQEINEGKPIENIKKAISNNYGQSIAQSIFNQLENLYNATNNNSKMNFSVELEKLFLECISKDIGSIKNENDAKKYANVYRAYKINNLPKIYKNDKECTNDYFGIKKMDQLLAKKLVEEKAFNFSSDNNTNIKIIESLLYTTNEEFAQINPDYEGIYLPPNLCTVKYKVENEDLYLNYSNRTETNSANRDVTIKINENKANIKEINKQERIKKIIL